jgi:hypothetical protein
MVVSDAKDRKVLFSSSHYPHLIYITRIEQGSTGEDLMLRWIETVASTKPAAVAMLEI